MDIEKSEKQLIEIVDKLISNFDPTPCIVNEQYPLRWESNIFIEDYDFSENYLDLNQSLELASGTYLRSVASAIEINKEKNGCFELCDGVFMVESHSWCSKLNLSENYPSYAFINQKFKSFGELEIFLVNNYRF